MLPNPGVISRFKVGNTLNPKCLESSIQPSSKHNWDSQSQNIKMLWNGGTDQLHRYTPPPLHTVSQWDRCMSTPLTARTAVSLHSAQEGNSVQTGVTVIISSVLCARVGITKLPGYSPLRRDCNYTHISNNTIFPAVRVWQLNTQTSHYCLHDFHIPANTHSLYLSISQRWSISLTHSHFCVQTALNTQTNRWVFMLHCSEYYSRLMHFSVIVYVCVL